MPIQEAKVVVLAPIAEAEEAAVEAIKQSGLGLRSIEQQGDVVVATITASLRSFGETLTVRAQQVGPTETELVVRSASAAALIDWGKNEDNVHRVIRAVRTIAPTR